MLIFQCMGIVLLAVRDYVFFVAMIILEYRLEELYSNSKAECVSFNEATCNPHEKKISNSFLETVSMITKEDKQFFF